MSESHSEHDDVLDDVRWARNYVQRRIDECQWSTLKWRLRGLDEPPEKAATFLASLAQASSSQREVLFTGVLSLASEHDGYRYERAEERAPPMPLTVRNRARLEAINFVVSADGYWAVYREPACSQ